MMTATATSNTQEQASLAQGGDAPAAGQPAGAAQGVGLAFAALILAMLPAVLDQTILATALPTIAGDLGRLTDVSLLVTAYVVAATASTPLWGKLGDRQGRKRMLQISLAGFVTA